MLLAVMIVFGLLIPTTLAATGDYAITVSGAPDNVEIGDEFTVTATLDSNASGFGAFQAKLVYDADVLEFKGFVREYNELLDQDVLTGSIIPAATANDNTGILAFSAAKNNTRTGTLFQAKFSAKAAGNTTIGLEIQDFGTIPTGGGMTSVAADATVTTDSVTVKAEAAKSGYTVALTPATQTKMVGETAKVAVEIGATGYEKYNAVDMKISYDAAKLTLDTTELSGYTLTFETGAVRVQGYGADKTLGKAFELSFTTKATGDANVKFTSAKVDNSANATTVNAPEAEQTNGTAVITVTGYTVSLPEDFTSETNVVLPGGDDYKFEATDKNYDYDVTAEVGTTTIPVTDNGDGTFTIKNSDITGNVTVTATKTAKSFDVTVTGTGAADVTAAAKATYLTDYTFTISRDSKYTYDVSAKCGESGTLTVTNNGDGSYTIAGADITDAITITVGKTLIPSTTTTITFVDGGAADVEGGTEQTANIGEDFNFKIKKNDQFDYTVTAKSGETPIDVTYSETDDTYTIAGKDVTATAITVTVTKTAKVTTTVEVHEYVKLGDAKNMYLVTATDTTLESGKVLAYDGTTMFWSGKYNAYAYLVISDKNLEAMKEEAAGKVAVASATSVTIAYDGDVNETNLVDINDAQLTYDMYNAKYTDFTTVAMIKFLEADMNASMNLTVEDAAAIVNLIK